MADTSPTEKRVPEAFANIAPDPKPPPALPTLDSSAGTKPDANATEKAQAKTAPPAGVPVRKLALWAIPVLVVTTGAAMYQSNPTVFAIVAGLGILMLLGAGIHRLVSNRAARGRGPQGGGSRRTASGRFSSRRPGAFPSRAAAVGGGGGRRGFTLPWNRGGRGSSRSASPAGGVKPTGPAAAGGNSKKTTAGGSWAATSGGGRHWWNPTTWGRSKASSPGGAGSTSTHTSNGTTRSAGGGTNRAPTSTKTPGATTGTPSVKGRTAGSSPGGTAPSKDVAAAKPSAGARRLPWKRNNTSTTSTDSLTGTTDSGGSSSMTGGGKKPARGKGSDQAGTRDRKNPAAPSSDSSSTEGSNGRNGIRRALGPLRRKQDRHDHQALVPHGDKDQDKRRGWRRKNADNNHPPTVDNATEEDTTRGKGRRGKKARDNGKPKEASASEDASQAVSSEGVDSNGAKSRRRWWPRRSKHAAQVETSEVSTNTEPTGRKAEDLTKVAKDEARREEKDRRRTDKTIKELGGIDDGGFASPPAKQIQRAPQRVVNLPIDDAGFPSPTSQAPRQTPPRPGTTPTSSTKEKPVNIDSYTAKVDKSSPAAARQSLTETADSARVDALKLEEEAEELRKQARLIQEQTALNRAASRAVNSAEDMLRQAAAKEEDAEKRKGLAAALDDKASSITA